MSNSKLRHLTSFNYLYLLGITLLVWTIILLVFIYPNYQNIITKKSIQNKLTSKIKFLDTQVQKQNLLINNFYKHQDKYKKHRASSIQNTYNKITQSAKSYNLKIISLNPINNHEHKISKENKQNKQNKISTQRINLKISGEYTNILKFIEHIKNNNTPIGIEKIIIKRSDYSSINPFDSYYLDKKNNIDLLLEIDFDLYKFQ